MDVFRLGNKIVIDDYAHHPSEINAVLNSIKDKYKDLEVGVIFQPHLFSRTKDLLDDFAKVLSKFDEVYLLDIYPAREEPIEGINSNVLLEKIICKKKDIIKIESINQKIESIESDIIAVLGAGNVANSIQDLKKKYKLLIFTIFSLIILVISITANLNNFKRDNSEIIINYPQQSYFDKQLYVEKLIQDEYYAGLIKEGFYNKIEKSISDIPGIQ